MPKRLRPSAIAVWLLLIGFGTGVAQAQNVWRDPSPHKVAFVEVQPGIRLEVLDWGGTGRPVVLLAGAGYTAHVFDEFAPKLTAHYHAYGITRRGFGASGYEPPSDVSKRLGEDVLAVIASLDLRRPVLVGHSIAGAELTWIANNQPDRIAGVVYLDAGYSYAFDNGKVENVWDLRKFKVPQPPPPTSSDLASFNALAKYEERTIGFAFPEGELHQQHVTKPDGTVGAERKFPGDDATTKLIGTPSQYATIPVPALFIFSNPHAVGVWVEHHTDGPGRFEITTYSSAMDSLVTKQEDALKMSLPGARVVNIPNADHFVFLSNQSDVLREMEGFLAGLTSDK